MHRRVTNRMIVVMRFMGNLQQETVLPYRQPTFFRPLRQSLTTRPMIEKSLSFCLACREVSRRVREPSGSQVVL